MTLLLPLFILSLSFVDKFSHAQVPTPAPTYQCQDDLIQFAQCIDSNGADPQACSDCFSAISNSLTSQTTCEQATTLVCDYIDSCASVCGGGNCASYMESYEGCLVGPTCFGSCSSTPSSPVAAPVMPTPTSPSVPTAPTPTSACSDQATAFATCIASNGQGVTECLSCIQDYGSSTTGTTATCDDATSITCGSAAACLSECGNCVDEQVALVNCENSDVCSPFTCSTTPTAPTTTSLPPAAAPAPAPSPSTDPCQEEVTAFATCVTTAGLSPTSCGTCLTGYLPDSISSCADSESYTCGAMTVCPECGPCQDEYSAISNCLNQGSCDFITCSTASTTPPTATKTSAPVNTPLSSPTLAVAVSPTRAPATGGGGGGGGFGQPTIPQPTIPQLGDGGTSSAGRPHLATLLAVVAGVAATAVSLGV